MEERERKEEKREEREKEESKGGERLLLPSLWLESVIYLFIYLCPRNALCLVRSPGLICCFLPNTLTFGNKGRQVQDGQGKSYLAFANVNSTLAMIKELSREGRMDQEKIRDKSWKRI